MIDELKEALYGILTADAEANEQEREVNINAHQQMGVSMTSAVKKDGVTIVQLQNVVHSTVIKNTVNALKILDKFQSDPRLFTPVKEPVLLEEGNGSYTVDEFIKNCLSEEMHYNDFMSEMSKKYVKAAVNIYETKKEASRKIKIGYVKLLKTLKEE